MNESLLDVALIATGGPRSLDDIPGFLQRVTGAAPDADTLRVATERYAHIGGFSPLLETTARQAAALQALLAEELGVPVRVRHGFLCSEPTVAQCMAELDGEQVVAVSLNPFAPRGATGRYREALGEAEARENGGRGRHIPLLDAWYADRGFARAISRRVAESLDGCFAHEWALLFTARSAPSDEIEEGDHCLDQLQQAIAQVLPVITPGGWSIAFLGKGRDGRWLEPAPDAALRELAAKGWEKVLVVPVGFISEDVETLYDLDVVLCQQAKSLGLAYRRSRTPDDSPPFITALADAVVHHMALRPAERDVHSQDGASPARHA